MPAGTWPAHRPPVVVAGHSIVSQVTGQLRGLGPFGVSAPLVARVTPVPCRVVTAPLAKAWCMG